MVSLTGALEGPRPLRVSGKATFEILWCDFTVRFDKTLVEGRAAAAAAGGRRARPAQAGARRAGELEHPAQRDPGARRRAAQPAAGRPPARRSCSIRWASWWSRSRWCRSTPARDIDTLRRRAGGRRRAASRSPPRSAATPLPRTRAAGAVRAGAVLRDERRREAGRAVVRVDGGGARLRRRAATFDAAQVIPAPLEYQHRRRSRWTARRRRRPSHAGAGRRTR